MPDVLTPVAKVNVSGPGAVDPHSPSCLPTCQASTERPDLFWQRIFTIALKKFRDFVCLTYRNGNPISENRALSAKPSWHRPGLPSTSMGMVHEWTDGGVEDGLLDMCFCGPTRNVCRQN